MVHLVEERARIAETCGRDDEFATLANAISHSETMDSECVIEGESYKTYAARVIAFPMSLYICLSITARDALSPLVKSV
jgi:hypothetical protein